MQTSQARQGFIRRFGNASRGAVAVEFAIVLLPFLVLMFGTIELGMIFLASSTLQTATDIAARQLRTGEFQATSTTKDQFKTLVCNNMTWLKTPCSSYLTVDVQTFANLADVGGASAIDPSNLKPNTTCWSPGQAGDVVLVRTYYEWHLFTPLLNQSLVNMGSGSGKRLITSATSFRNEPWSSSPPTGAAC